MYFACTIHERDKVQKSVLMILVGIAILAGGIGASIFVGQDTTTPATQPEQSTNKETEITPPTFDVVRVNHEGNAVMAGRAHPGSTVEVLDGDSVFGTVKTDSRGEWVFVPDRVLDVGEHKLGLRMLLEGKDPILSDHIVLMRVPERGKDALALKVRRDGEGPSEVLQKPGSATDTEKNPLSIDSVDYDNNGLSISGHGEPGSQVRIYIDNNFIGAVQTNEKGIWTLDPQTEIAAGKYKLRADQVDKSAKVINRVEIPFQRDPINNTAGLEPGSFVVVQPGNSLWRLARRTYGSGVRYHDIYEANASQIKDANLIYPGQIFRLPKDLGK